ncbi:TIGR04372 family glycosyltransferase [Gammaproteobacteria bacterium]|nr:TIGR04372 family glycosyltransferase [Gammaproteobacteria bacterium]
MLKILLKKIVVLTIGLTLVFFIRFFSLVIPIRLGYFYGERIGHFAKDVELYLAEKTLNSHIKTIDLFFIGGKSSNSFLLKLVKRKITVNRLVSIIHTANKLLPNNKKYEYIPSVEKQGNTADLKGLLPKTKPHLSFTDKEDKTANAFLKSIGCNKKFVCLSIRDSGYLKETFPHNNFSYHNYRDSEVETYISSIEYLLENDFFVIRMGKIVNDSLDIKHDNFLDYASSDLKNDFLDIWLMANCSFCISTSTGLDEVSDIFRVPIVYVNALAIANYSSWNKGCIWTPKTIVSKKNMAPLSVDELIATGAIGIPEKGTYQELLDKNNLTYIDNTADEILSSVSEMLLKFNNQWEYSYQRQDRQKLFWKKLQTWPLFKKYHNINQEEPIGIISDTYLEKNKDWFFN